MTARGWSPGWYKNWGSVFYWINPPEQAFGGLYDAWTQQIYNAVYALLVRMAPRIENWMKENAPWTDRTGNARQSLWTTVIPQMTEIILILAHGVEYGKFLEHCNAGAYSVIAPALDEFGPEIMSELARMGFAIS